jgi:hypothetical protein
MQEIKDIWFRTDLDLTDLGKRLGLQNITHDYENYWEWIIGQYGRHQFDITRTHSKEPGNSDARIFLLNGENLPDDLIADFISQLRLLNVTPIYLGSWKHLSDNTFQKLAVEEIT